MSHVIIFLFPMGRLTWQGTLLVFIFSQLATSGCVPLLEKTHLCKDCFNCITVQFLSGIAGFHGLLQQVLWVDSCWRARFSWKKVTKYKERKCCQLLIEWQSLHTGVARQSHVYPRPLLTKGLGLLTEDYSLRVSLDCARSIFPKITAFSALI